MAPKGGIRKRVLEDDPTQGTGSRSSRDIAPDAQRSLRQRVTPASTSGTAPEAALPFNNTLKRDWGKGDISSKRVQEYAMAASQQGAIGLDAVSMAGSSGKNPQNIQRSLLRRFGQPPGSPEISWFNIPTTRGVVPHPFMLPHVWFHSLYHNAP